MSAMDFEPKSHIIAHILLTKNRDKVQIELCDRMIANYMPPIQPQQQMQNVRCLLAPHAQHLSTVAI